MNEQLERTLADDDDLIDPTCDHHLNSSAILAYCTKCGEWFDRFVEFNGEWWVAKVRPLKPRRIPVSREQLDHARQYQIDTVGQAFSNPIPEETA